MHVAVDNCVNVVSFNLQECSEPLHTSLEQCHYKTYNVMCERSAVTDFMHTYNRVQQYHQPCKIFIHYVYTLVCVTIIIILKFMSGNKYLHDRYTHHHTCSCHHMCIDLQPHMDNRDPCSHQDIYMMDHKSS